MKLKIETNQPIPTLYSRHQTTPLLRTMKVGESFFKRLNADSRELNHLRVTASRITKETGHVFTVRKVKYGYRVWRTA